MRKKIIVSVLLSSVLLTGCSSNETAMGDGPKFEKSRFEYVDTLDEYWSIDMYLIRDKETGVNYILSNGYCASSMCPLYDENGNVVITK